MTAALTEWSQKAQDRIAKLISDYLFVRPTVAPSLREAMFYAMSNGGKRIRPLCVYATGELLGASWETLDVPALAIELMHGFSLIHDDLPAMDNSDLRRGKPSCHKMFGEATAILAGDALQTLAFEIIACHPAPLSAEKRLAMTKILSQRSGQNGMTGGQALDMTGAQSLDDLITMYSLKTGALSSACIELALLAADTVDDHVAASLQTFITCMGLAFQIQDDLLDEMGTEACTGKKPGMDLKNQKKTYPVLTSRPQAQTKVQELLKEALAAITPFGPSAERLSNLAKSMVYRSK